MTHVYSAECLSDCSGAYSGGQQCSFNSVTYEAKWWTDTAPPSFDWHNLGSCELIQDETEILGTESQELIYLLTVALGVMTNTMGFFCGFQLANTICFKLGF